VITKVRRYFSFLAVNLEAGDYLENFLVSAVFSIVIIRVFLVATGYPQLGGSGLHIAHMLWGGFLIGLGFGVFIDELGKFITHDNNYFFQPAFAFIYIIFVLMFLAVRAIEKSMKVLQKDYTINALEVIKEVVLHDLDEDEKKRALAYLQKSNKSDIVVKTLMNLLRSEKTVDSIDIYFPTKVKRFLHRKYLDFVRKKRFAGWISQFFVVYAIFELLSNVYYYSFFYGIKAQFTMTFWDWGLLLSPFVSGTFVLVGFLERRRKGNLFAYSKYKQAVLFTILIRQFFLFYKLQLAALFGLTFNITVMVALQFLISQETIAESK
jgi:hypothetical protein